MALQRKLATEHIAPALWNKSGPAMLRHLRLANGPKPKGSERSIRAR